MTRKEAIKILKSMSDISTQGEAIDMAIEALHREEAEAKGYCHRINYIPKPCENANCDCVAVVRCKDCRHGQYDATHYFCAEHHHKVYGDDYCSYGERQCNYFGERR